MDTPAPNYALSPIIRAHNMEWEADDVDGESCFETINIFGLIEQLQNFY